MSAPTLTRPQAIALAQRMYDGGTGWSIREIRDHLAGRGQDVTAETVRAWADPVWAERRRAKQRVSRRNYWRRTKGVKSLRITNDFTAGVEKLARLRTLRSCGVSFPSLVRIAAIDFGDALTEEQVRYALQVDRYPASGGVVVGRPPAALDPDVQRWIADGVIAA